MSFINETAYNKGYHILWVSVLPKVRNHKKGMASGL